MLPAGIRRLFRLFRGHGDVDDDLDAEIAFHLDTKAEALVAAGMPAEAARAEALRQFGDVRAARAALAAIDHRDTGRRLRAEWLEEAWSDLRFAARGLRRTPGFTSTVVVTLALGLGATAAMFGVLDRLLLRPPIGVRDPGHVVRLYVRHSKPVYFGSRYQRSFSYAESGDFRGATSVAGLAFDGGSFPVTLDDSPVKAQADLVSGGYFTVLGVRPALGRLLLPADDSAGSPPVAVLSYGWWQGRYGGEPSIVGRIVHVEGRAYTIAGVAPRGFSGLSPQTVDLWLPVGAAGTDVFGSPTRFFDWRTNSFQFEAVARVRSAVAPARAAAELTLTFHRREALLPPNHFMLPDSDATVELGSVIPGQFRVEVGELGESLSLSLLVAAVALVVGLIATANVANLLLLRALARRRETGIRLALGVGRWRLVRAVLAESLLLAAVAAAAAALVASAGGELLRKLLLGDEWATPLFGLRVFGFVALTAFAVGTLTGLVPAFFGGRTDVLASLKAGVRLSAWRRSRARAALMVAQVALTLVLLAGFGLFARSFERATSVNFGVDARHLLVVTPPTSGGKVPPGFVAALLSRVRSIPGVRAAAAEQGALPMYGYGAEPLRAEGADSVPFSNDHGPFFSEIAAGYLEASGLRLVRGRAFEANEYASPGTVALVNEEMARRLWTGQGAIGKCLYVRLDMEVRTEPPCSVIVGIVQNTRRFVWEPPIMQYYLPLAVNIPSAGSDIVVRSAGDPSRLVAPVTAVAKSLEADLHIAVDRKPAMYPDRAVRSIPDILGQQERPWRLGAALFAMFAALALLVAMVGIYAVVAFDAAQRRGEFGIRVALGARARDLAGLMLGQGLRYGAAGLLLGLALVVVAGRLVASQLFRTSPGDPLALGAAALLLLAAMLAACALPARSAARADPRIALQAE